MGRFNSRTFILFRKVLLLLILGSAYLFSFPISQQVQDWKVSILGVWRKYPAKNLYCLGTTEGDYSVVQAKSSISSVVKIRLEKVGSIFAMGEEPKVRLFWKDETQRSWLTTKEIAHYPIGNVIEKKETKNKVTTVNKITMAMELKGIEAFFAISPAISTKVRKGEIRCELSWSSPKKVYSFNFQNVPVLPSNPPASKLSFGERIEIEQIKEGNRIPKEYSIIVSCVQGDLKVSIIGVERKSEDSHFYRDKSLVRGAVVRVLVEKFGNPFPSPKNIIHQLEWRDEKGTSSGRFLGKEEVIISGIESKSGRKVQAFEDVFYFTKPISPNARKASFIYELFVPPNTVYSFSFDNIKL
jgi:ribosomal protein S8E